MSPAADLSTLVVLDRRRLHVFVAGPGYGEGIAVALPDQGWLLVDGCLADRRSPLLAIVERWRQPGEQVDCLALTHPHRDHAQGFRRVLEEAAPASVAITALPEDPLGAIAELAPALSTITSDELRRRAVADALLAIQRFALARPGRLLALHAGASITTSSSHVVVVTRAPERDLIAAHFAAGRLGGPLDPNELSAVFEIEFGSTRVVLGSDLTTSGWTPALAARPELGAHHGLKVPHHGSPTGHHPELMPHGSERAWMVAPFSPCQLPAVHGEGLPWLVARNGLVLLTAAPLAHSRQPFPPAEVAVDELAALFSRGAPAGSGAVAISPPIGLRAFDAVWCVAFDDAGAVCGRWRGPRAFAVVPASPTP